MPDKQLNKNTSHLINISPQMLMDWIQNGSVILADVRETGEFETERIKSAHSYPLSTFSPESLSKSLKTHNEDAGLLRVAFHLNNGLGIRSDLDGFRCVSGLN